MLWVSKIVCWLDHVDVAMQRAWQAVLCRSNDFGTVLVAVFVVLSVEKTLDF